MYGAPQPHGGKRAAPCVGLAWHEARERAAEEKQEQEGLTQVQSRR